MISLRFARSVIRRGGINQLTVSDSFCISANVANMSDKLEVAHDSTRGAFTITLEIEGTPERAILEYSKLQDNSVDLHHTEVPTAFRGKGIAKVLAKEALDHFSASQTKMHLTCTYLQKYIQDNPNPEYLAYVVK